MEKIKQALDKAREERGNGILGRNSTQRSNDSVADGNFQRISYSETKVLERPSSETSAKRLIAPTQSDRFATAFKMLRTQVLQRMKANGWNALAVTSPMPGNGKTLVSANLAISLSMELHHTVLLVDLDLRKPSVHRFFEFEPAYGVADYLIDDVPIGNVLVNPGIERLVLLPSRGSIPNSSELLASPKTGNMVEELKNRYPSRFVLFDLPPILVADDAIAFSPYIDAILLVIEDGVTTRDELGQAMDLLEDTPIIGTVLNRSDELQRQYE